MKRTFRGKVAKIREEDSGRRVTAVIRVDNVVSLNLTSWASDPEAPHAHKEFDDLLLREGDKVTIKVDKKG